MKFEEANRSRGVSFDLWRTLIAERDGNIKSPPRGQLRARWTSEIVSGIGYERSFETTLAAFLRLNEQIFNDQLNGFDLDFKARVTQLLGLLGIEEPSAALVGEVGEAIDKAFLELPPQIIPGALDTLDKVKRGGFRIALLSNTGMNSETLYDYWLERIGLSSYFDYTFLSSRKGLAKPNVKAFQDVLRELRVDNTALIHVGDNLRTDVSGARDSAVTVVWLNYGDNSQEGTATPDFEVDGIAAVGDVVERWASCL